MKFAIALCLLPLALTGCAYHAIDSQIYDPVSKQLVPCHAQGIDLLRNYQEGSLSACGGTAQAKSATDDAALIQAIVKGTLAAMGQ